jgi:hypothetical protein
MGDAHSTFPVEKKYESDQDHTGRPEETGDTTGLPTSLKFSGFFASMRLSKGEKFMV